MDTNVLPQVEFALEALAYIESQLDSRIKDFYSSRRFHRKQLLRITIFWAIHPPSKNLLQPKIVVFATGKNVRDDAKWSGNSR